MKKYMNKYKEKFELIKIIKRLSSEEVKSLKKKGKKSIYMESR